MRSLSAVTTIGLLAAAVQIGCTSPAPRRVHVPAREQAAAVGPRYEHEHMKPLPQPERTNLPRPYDDVPLVSQRPPEQKAFVDAYERVGRPRLMVMAIGPDGSSSADKSYKLAPVDYSAVETVLADWLSANGAVNLLSSRVAPASSVEPTTRPAPAPEADADVLVRVQVHPANSNVQEARLVTEAVNTRGGESIARAVVDVPAPLEKERLNDATRFVARKLMDEMTESWNRMATGARSTPPAPTSGALAPAPNPGAPAREDVGTLNRAPAQPVAPAPAPQAPTVTPPAPAVPRSSGTTPPTIVIPPPSTTTAPTLSR